MSQSRLGRNPLQKKKASAVSPIIEGISKPKQSESASRVLETYQQPPLLERLRKMDIHLEVDSLIKQISQLF